jgi:hypothetical protein
VIFVAHARSVYPSGLIRNETRALSLMSALRVNRGTGNSASMAVHRSRQLAAAPSIGGADGGVARGLSPHFQIWMTAF